VHQVWRRAEVGAAAAHAVHESGVRCSGVGPDSGFQPLCTRAECGALVWGRTLGVSPAGVGETMIQHPEHLQCSISFCRRIVSLLCACSTLICPVQRLLPLQQVRHAQSLSVTVPRRPHRALICLVPQPAPASPSCGRSGLSLYRRPLLPLLARARCLLSPPPAQDVPACCCALAHLGPSLPPLLVCSVLIFEATEPGFPDDQAVRIFVEFSRIEEATKVGSNLRAGG
jgi:hypothetical protein